MVDGAPHDDRPVLPDYRGACLTNVVPGLLRAPGDRPAWLPEPARHAGQVLLLVLDGLGWEQLQERRALAPTLATLEGGTATSVVPSTTATALASLVTGTAPADHGIVGYRMMVDGAVLNVLRWRTAAGDARLVLPPAGFAVVPPFRGAPVPVVTRAEFGGSGFSAAHLGGAPFVGWRVPSTLVVECRRLLRAGEPLVYAYYDGIDRVAHEFGFGAHYDAELSAVDRLVADLLGALPAGAALVVTADHGQVQVGAAVVTLDGDVDAMVAGRSGEGRFRWLHARPGAAAELRAAVAERHAAQAWVASADEIVAAGWFGGPLGDAVRARIGDVALVARRPVAFADPADTGESRLVCRHGSLTAAEMLVPLLASHA